MVFKIQIKLLIFIYFILASRLDIFVKIRFWFGHYFQKLLIILYFSLTVYLDISLK